jgi:hypothetical protein
VVRFDGSNDRFNDRITLAAKNNNEITVFAAVNPKAKGDWNYLMYRYDNQRPSLAGNSKNTWEWNNNRNDWKSAGVANGRSTGWQVVTGVVGAQLYKNGVGTGHKLFINGTVVGVNTYSSDLSPYPDYNFMFHRENNHYFSGDVGEGKQ